MNDSPRIFLCAGEASGDRYAAALARRILARRPDARLTGVGGPRMAAAGATVHLDLAAHATMGFRDVFRNLGTFARLLRRTDRLMAADAPHVAVFIDNPGFNLRAAAAARRRGIHVVYYVSPQVWAWHRSRIRKIAALVDKMLVILPFERDLYRAHGVDVEFVGHPLLDYMAETPLDPAKVAELSQGGGRLVGLLPGSRRGEVERVFPLIAEAAARLQAEIPHLRFAAGCAQEGHVGRVAATLARAGVQGARVYADRTFEIMKASHVCLAVSGTVTLELAYFGRPMVIVYRAPRPAKPLARLLLRTQHIGLANIVAGREVVPEHFLFRADAGPVAASARRLLCDRSAYERCREDLRETIARLGEPGASDRAARAVLEQAERRRDVQSR